MGEGIEENGLERKEDTGQALGNPPVHVLCAFATCKAADRKQREAVRPTGQCCPLVLPPYCLSCETGWTRMRVDPTPPSLGLRGTHDTSREEGQCQTQVPAGPPASCGVPGSMWPLQFLVLHPSVEATVPAPVGGKIQGIQLLQNGT